MKFPTKFFLLFLFSVLSGCAIHNPFVTEQKEAWFNDPDLGLVYCRANVKADGSADPTCYETGFKNFEKEQKLK